MRNGMVVWGAVVGVAVLIAACGGKSGTSGSQSVPPPLPGPVAQHFLTVSKSGSGTVRSAPAGIDCGTTCSATLAEGTQMVLTPVPDPGWQFAGWGGGCTGLGGCALKVVADTKVFVTFEAVAPAAPGKHNVTVTPSGAGAGRISSSPAGIDCGSTCTAQFDDGTRVVFNATPATGSTFAGWTGACAGTATTCELSGTPEFADGATPAAAVVKLDADGKFLWEKRLNEDGSTLAVNAKGDAVFRSWSSTDPSTTSVVRVGADGSPVWTLSSRGLAEVGIDPDGNVVVGAFTSQTDPIFGQTFASNGPVVAKLASADGNVLWAKRIAAGTIGNIQGVGVDASGAIVAAGRIGGAFDFGGQHFDTAGNPSSALMFVFEPDGKERVARVLPDTNEVLLAVDPPGRASLAGAGRATAEWV